MLREREDGLARGDAADVEVAMGGSMLAGLRLIWRAAAASCAGDADVFRGRRGHAALQRTGADRAHPLRRRWRPYRLLRGTSTWRSMR